MVCLQIFRDCPKKNLSFENFATCSNQHGEGNKLELPFLSKRKQMKSYGMLQILGFILFFKLDLFFKNKFSQFFRDCSNEEKIWTLSFVFG
jgi:hypothetical protein